MMQYKQHLLKLLTIRNLQTSQKRWIDSSKVEEVRIPVPWGHIAGRWWGSKETTPVLAVHGLLDNAASFDKLAPLLETDSLLTLDLPGHGKSSHVGPGIMFHFFDHVIFLRYLIKHHFNWTNLTLLGHSFGGSLWFMYASLYPEDVHKFISIDGATYTIAPKIPKTGAHIRNVITNTLAFEKKLENPPPEYTFDELVQVMFKSRKESRLDINEEACRILLTRGVVQAESGKFYLSRDLRLNSRALGTCTTSFIMALSERIKCQVLYIRTTSSIIINDWLKAYEESLDIMRKSAQRVENYTVEGGHHAHLENPERVAPIINKFLNT